MKPKFKPYTAEEFDRKLNEMLARYGKSIKRTEPKQFDQNKPKTYEVTFHKIKKI